jgi:hypothetical protein
MHPIRDAVGSGMGEELRMVIWYWERVLAKECSSIAGNKADIIHDKIVSSPIVARLGVAKDIGLFKSILT